jgi:hypothetical protein
LIYTLFAAYVPAFIYNLTHTASYDIISDDIDIVTREINEDDAYEDFDSRYADVTPPESPIRELDVQETIVVNEKDRKFSRLSQPVYQVLRASSGLH